MFLERFINYLKFEKRYSNHTLNAYKRDISQFLEYLSQQEVLLTSATHFNIRSWMVELMEIDSEPKTLNRKLSSLRSFFRFLLREEYLLKDPTILVQVPKIPKRLPMVVEETKVSSLLDSAVFSDDFWGLRDRLIIELLFGTGIRLSELLSLKDADVNFYDQTIKVLGKRSKERIIPLNNTLSTLLKNYLQKKKEISIIPALIITNKGEAAYTKLVYRIVNKYLSLISTQSKKSPHVLRHTFATTLLNKGADLNAIKELLGHSGLAATEVYTHNSVERLKSIYKQSHPKA